MEFTVSRPFVVLFDATSGTLHCLIGNKGLFTSLCKARFVFHFICMMMKIYNNSACKYSARTQHCSHCVHVLTHEGHARSMSMAPKRCYSGKQTEAEGQVVVVVIKYQEADWGLLSYQNHASS